MKAPAPKSGRNQAKKPYSAKSRADCNDSTVSVKGQCSSGALSNIGGGDPEEGTTKFSATSDTGSD